MTRTNDAYAWQAHYNVDRTYIADGLNRIMSAGGIGFSYDARGNLVNDGTNGFTYTAENLLKTGPAGATLGYDPLGRLYQTVGGGVTTRFQYDGIDLIAEYNASNAVQRRYVHGPGIDNAIVWYEGSGTGDRRFLMADERGSIVSITDSAGATIAINAYDEYGIPAPGNIGRFGYTGQTWLPEVGMWHYKARIYSPTLGRFLQTDPIGYADGMNWYAYVGGDPVNFTDPSGWKKIYCDSNGKCTDENGNPVDPDTKLGPGDTVTTAGGTWTSDGRGGGTYVGIIVVTAPISQSAGLRFETRVNSSSQNLEPKIDGGSLFGCLADAGGGTLLGRLAPVDALANAAQTAWDARNRNLPSDTHAKQGARWESRSLGSAARIGSRALFSASPIGRGIGAIVGAATAVYNSEDCNGL